MGDDTSVYALYQQGQEWLQTGKPRQAAELLEQAVAVEPDKASLHETLGRAYFAAARLGPARAAFKRALASDPSSAYANFGVGRCYEREGKLRWAAKYYKLACALSDRVDYAEALLRISARMEALPTAPPADQS